MKRILIFSYGLLCYAIFQVTFLYMAGFLGNIIVPKTIDSPAHGPFWQALLVNLGLITLFGLQHSVMARPAFKRWWTRYIPEPAERSTYVLFSSLALIALFVGWQPMGGVLWQNTNSASVVLLNLTCAAGWALVLYSTYLIDHYDLFGVRQVWLHLRGRAYTPPEFRTPAAYRIVRHPLYVGLLIAFWATPVMTAAHLVFAAGMTVYILLGIRFEERDLAATHPDYEEYRHQVPMLLPIPAAKRSGAALPAEF